MRCRRLFAISTSAFPGWLVTMAPAWLLCAALLAAGPALASTFTAPMDGLQEVSPNGSTATGFATITVVGNLLSVDVTWSGLTAVPAAAHIHCCVDPGANIGVAISFPSFPAVTGGTYLEDFDLLDPSVYTASFVNNFGGGTVAGARDVLLAGLEAGWAYVNIHNAVFPGGEIRGNVVPEPSAHSLLAVALATTIACRRAATRRLRLHGRLPRAAALAKREPSRVLLCSTVVSHHSDLLRELRLNPAVPWEQGS